MEKSLATTAALTGLNNEQLAKLKDTAETFAGNHAGITADQIVSSFTRMHEIFQDTGKALNAAELGAMLGKFGVGADTAAQLFGVTATNLGASAQTTADQLIRTTRLFGINSSQDVGRFAMVIGRLGGLAKNTNTPLAELMSLTGEADKAFGGGRGMMSFASVIGELAASGKSGVDWSHGLVTGLEQLRSKIAGFSGTAQLEQLKQPGAGETEAPQLLTLLNRLDEVRSKTGAVQTSAITIGKAFATATSNAADRLTLMHQNLENFYDAIASPALPFFSAAFQRLTGYIQSATAVSEKHTSVGRDFVIGLSSLGIAGQAAVSAMSTLGATSIFVGKGMEALSKDGWIATLATKGLAAAQWVLNAALDANPFVIAAGAVALLGIGVYEIYEHWKGITTFFKTTFTEIENIFAGLGSRMELAGINLMKSLGHGILAGVEFPLHAAEGLASRIEGYFVGHSPPPFGPLHNLGRITIAETIADRIRPAPILAAITRTAAAVAVAAPLMAAPAAAGPGAGGASFVPGGGGATVVNFTMNINGSKLDKDDLIAAARAAAYELEKILERERDRKERTNLS